MKIGLVLAGMPTYSETFLLSKIGVLERTGHEVHLFAAGSPLQGGPFRRLHTGYDVRLRGVERQLARGLALLRMAAHARKTARLYRLNRRDGLDARRNLISLLNAAHIIGHRLDWIHFAFATTALSLENIGRATGARMAVSVRGFDISLFPLKNPGCYARLWQRIDRLHYISEALYRRALADGLPAQLPAYRIEPAADPGLRDRFRKPPERPDGIPRLLTVGRLTWKKGYVQTLTALAGLKAGGHRFTYHLVGEGEGLEEVLYMRRALGLEDEVVLEGRRSHDETLALVAGCDVYLQYSVQEGYCNAVVEAQLLGRPCIVSDAEGLPENVVDGVTGWVVPANDPGRLRAKVEEVLALPAEARDRIGRAASDRIAGSYSLDAQLAKYIRFYED
jgi:colanic acid/amylovoran biosynthesis glycosyltransferase